MSSRPPSGAARAAPPHPPLPQAREEIALPAQLLDRYTGGYDPNAATVTEARSQSVPPRSGLDPPRPSYLEAPCACQTLSDDYLESQDSEVEHKLT
jgi:hypothetical protein